MMKIAVTYENGQVFQHFGRTRQFKIYRVEGGTVQDASVLDAGESGHGALAGLLKGRGVDTLICGGIGGGAQSALGEAGIRLYGGVTGDADGAVADLLAGRLVFDSQMRCGHHGGHDHTCGPTQKQSGEKR